VSSPEARTDGARRAPWFRMTDWRSDRVLLAGLLSLGVVIPVALGYIAGSLEVPRNDDWVYRRIALELAQTGVLTLHNVTAMMVGHILAVQPLFWLSGLRLLAFSEAGIVYAVAAVLSTYVLARQFLAPRRATIATLLLLIFPGYLAYATSFMTDVPALACQMTCLAFGVVALGRKPISGRWLLAAAMVGCVGFSFREFAIAAPASVMVGAILAEPRRLRHWILAGAVISSCALLFFLKAALPGQDLRSGSDGGAISQSIYALSSVALVLLPVALIGAYRWRHEWKRIDVAIGAELGFLVVVIRVIQAYGGGAIPPVIMGDLASQWGVPVPGIAIGSRPVLFTQGVWAFIGVVALVATVVVLAIGTGIAGAYLRQCRSVNGLIQRLRSPLGLLVLFTSAIVVGLTFYGLRFPLFDRYYWPLVPAAAILFLYRPRRSRSVIDTTRIRNSVGQAIPLAAILSLLSVVSMIFMLNSLAFDAARWRAGERLVELGVAPEEVDAGYEWVGFFQPVLPAARDFVATQTLYQDLWPGRRECGIVSSSKEGLPGSGLVGTEAYSLFLVMGPEETLYLYRLVEPACLSASVANP
jgi:Dolichyl-phosphate-mannose-protein mannosyltransferase